MNQIINIDLNKNIDNSEIPENVNTSHSLATKKKLSKKILNVQFFLSIIAIGIITVLFMYYKMSLNNEENFANLLMDNYSITKLYSNNQNEINQSEFPIPELAPDSIIGVIEIPILNLSYPFFYELTDELLKTSPCRFYGSFPYTSQNKEDFNLCIAGHNYDNDKFFSKIKNLNMNDKILLYDTINNTFTYSVIENYEVKSDDLSPVYNTITDSYELTLVTCNNFNGNRIIIKAKIEDV